MTPDARNSTLNANGSGHDCVLPIPGSGADGYYLPQVCMQTFGPEMAKRTPSAGNDTGLGGRSGRGLIPLLFNEIGGIEPRR